MDLLNVFDIIIFFYGGYTIYSTIKMKKTGVANSWLLGNVEIKDPNALKGFIDYMYKKTILFGCVAVIYGAVSICSNYVLELGYYAESGLIIVFLLVCIFFGAHLYKAKKRYFPI